MFLKTIVKILPKSRNIILYFVDIVFCHSHIFSIPLFLESGGWRLKAFGPMVQASRKIERFRFIKLKTSFTA